MMMVPKSTHITGWALIGNNFVFVFFV